MLNTNRLRILSWMVLMPSDPIKDKGPTVKEFVLFWVVIVGVSVAIAWHKGHFIWQVTGVE